jgi:hypothetical protein
MGLLIFILLNYGMSNIIVYGSIFNGFREFWKSVSPNFFGKLFSCMMCTPFWTGSLLSITFQLMGYNDLSPSTSYGVNNLFLSIFFDGVLASGTTWLLHTFQEMMERAFPEE